MQLLRREIGGPYGLASLRWIDLQSESGPLRALYFYAEPDEVANRDELSLAEVASNLARALAGLAAVTRQSGQWRGKAFIEGGRPILRQPIYKPALVAIRFSPPVQAKYGALRAAGKPAKLAITAIMRRIITIANAVLRDNRKWTEIRP